MKSIKRLYYIFRIIIVMNRFKRWSMNCDDELKREICSGMYISACFAYNGIKYGWMPKASAVAEQLQSKDGEV